MHGMRIGLVAILVLLAVLMTPASTFAAPAIAVSPTQTPPGGNVTVTGTGFAPNAALALFGLTARGTMRVRLAEITAGADGGFTTTFRVAGFYPAAPLPLVVVSIPDGAELARATVTVTDAPSIAPEKLTVAPSAGPAGTRFTATGEGFAAGTTVAFYTVESAKGPSGSPREVARVQIPADGRVGFSFDSTGYSPEGYDLVAHTGGIIIGFPLVRPTFTVTAASAPGLPNTGAGGRAGSAASVGPLLSALAALGIAGGLASRRRRARQ